MAKPIRVGVVGFGYWGPNLVRNLDRLGDAELVAACDLSESNLQKLSALYPYVETTSRLTPRLDIGLYKDLAIYTRIPIVLSNSRRIDEPDEAAGNIAAVTGGAPGETLFTLPFEAPDRSGAAGHGQSRMISIRVGLSRR